MDWLLGIESVFNKEAENLFAIENVDQNHLARCKKTIGEIVGEGIWSICFNIPVSECGNDLLARLEQRPHFGNKVMDLHQFQRHLHYLEIQPREKLM